MIKTIFLSCLMAASSFAQCPLILTEIQADPTPSRGLPEVEYLEFYSDSPTPLSLQGWYFQVNSTRISFPNQVIPPFSYFVVVAESQKSKVAWDAQTVYVSRLTLPNEGADISWHSPTTRCHSLRYVPQWGARYMEGGYSLELQNKEGWCLGETLWASTQSQQGGTPGKAPTQGYQPLPIPRIEKVQIDSMSWEIHFAQAMRPTAGVWKANPLNCQWISDRICRQNELLPKNTWQEGYLTEFEDCTGQILSDTLLSFGRFDPPNPGEWVLNEILVDPLPGTSGFIELKSTAQFPKLWKGGVLVYQSLTSSRKIEITLGQDGKILPPQEVWAFTKANPGWNQLYQTGKSIVFLNQWSDFSNEGGTFTLKRHDGVVLDQLTYSTQWNHELIKAEDGRSWQKVTSGWMPTPTLWGLATPGWEPKSHDVVAKWTFEPAYLSKSNREAILHFSLPDDRFTLQARIYDRFGQMWYQYPTSHFFPKQGSLSWFFPELPGKSVHYFVYFEGFHPDGRLFREWVPFIWEIN